MWSNERFSIINTTMCIRLSNPADINTPDIFQSFGWFSAGSDAGQQTVSSPNRTNGKQHSPRLLHVKGRFAHECQCNWKDPVERASQPEQRQRACYANGAAEHPGVAGVLWPGSNSGDGFLDCFLELSFEVAPVKNFHRALQQLLEFAALDSWAQRYGNL